MTAQFPRDGALLEVEAPTSRATPMRTSDVLAHFRAHLPPERVSLGDVIAALGDRSLGTILLVVSLPTVAPVPLGVSVLFNLPLLLFSIRLLFGKDSARLPGWLLRRSVERATAARMLGAVLPRLRWIERMLQPRLRVLAGIDRARWFGFLCVLLAVIAFVPVPLMGWLPGFALVFLSLGLIERDGVAVGAGLLVGAGAVLFAAALVGGLSYAGHELLGPP